MSRTGCCRRSARSRRSAAATGSRRRRSALGRRIAVALMLVRLGVFRRARRTVLSFYLERRGSAGPKSNSDLHEVLERLACIERQLDQQSAQARAPVPVKEHASGTRLSEHADSRVSQSPASRRHAAARRSARPCPDALGRSAVTSAPRTGSGSPDRTPCTLRRLPTTRTRVPRIR